MSARRLGTLNLFNPVTVHSSTTRLDLAPNAVTIRKSGIEFRSRTPIDPWTEMTVALESPFDTKKVQCTGVVVRCHLNRQAGYDISILFTDLSPQAQARLNSLAATAYSRLA